ncbi:MAG: CO dehydrogenase/acetyl-CoA synthase subunit delta [Candidatus Hydrothermarchaeota archaeon]|nr:CO dehydrogenase/acetyl-CoA synthase subunit delta [Candidatus Hydrothermarchaeota archaeon]
MAKVNLDEIVYRLLDAEEVELEKVSITAEELAFNLRQAEVKLLEKKRIKFEPPIRQYKGKIAEVQLGATRAEGGSRGKVVKLGGQASLYHFEGGRKNKPVVAFDVFDMPMPSFPKVLRDIWSEVWDDPGEWAKKAVKLGTEMVTVHLISTDPFIKDTPPREAAKTIEEVLQAVDVPLIIGGSGNPQKDPLVFEKVAEAAEGEMLLLASANLDLDHKRIVDAANKYRHNVLSFTSMNITDQQALNRLLRDEGLPKERLVQDPTTGALGYGLDYTYSIIERLKQNALSGDDVLQNPIFCGVTNAWAAREAWMDEPAWGPREYRGPLWETITAVTVLNAGADGMMMLHPEAVKAVKEIIDSMSGELRAQEIKYENWLSEV